MIIFNLKGGLGNQMFQYALGRKLSLQNKDILKLDATLFDKENQRRYTLGHFLIQGDIATQEEIRRIKNPHGPLSHLKHLFKKKVLRQFNVRFLPEILLLKGDIYLEGYWQSEKYFKDIRPILLNDFTLKDGLSEQATRTLMQIRNTKNPVSIHVRRGDYVKSQEAKAYHDMCSPSYYRQALEIIKNKTDSPSFFIFSDDIDWVKGNLKLEGSVTYVSNPAIKDYEELILMSACKHNIIANSSFSWWGAWLNQNLEKIVIAPEKWANISPKIYKDIVPESWIKI
ncbi:MAG: alpha-1,2-fucosyltransferase [Candidatus Pacebacteria bacterium]|nr:alpha-1,2-fucosyltransferase [Candidatus Paceibacterota bacterium]MDD5356535.1 alpha-1,2-fucosyltransferase [Candidatus Paceibacterota bacterium]